MIEALKAKIQDLQLQLNKLEYEKELLEDIILEQQRELIELRDIKSWTGGNE